MVSKNETKYKQGLIQATANFPLPAFTKIDLKALHEKLKGETVLSCGNGHPAYLKISLTLCECKNSFNVFENGKVVCWHSISPKAWHFFLDFFYYTYAVNCLGDTK